MKSFLLLSIFALAWGLSKASGEEEPAALTLLKDAVFTKGAMCLDGSPPGYYFRAGKESGANKWILHLQGGGWCFKGIEDCYNRSFTKLGSSNNWTQSENFGGALSSDVEVNPAFYNWNMVFFMYCDGASFSANREGPDVWDGEKLYYRGFSILNVIMEDLNTNRNLQQATDVVLTGCSAGGLAVYMHMNHIQTLIPPTARFSGMPDAGYFLDIPSFKRDALISSFFGSLIKFQGIDEGLMEECKADNSGDMIYKCMYAPYIYKYIKAPLLVINSRVDTAQLNDLFSLPCLPPHCDAEEMQYFNDFSKSFAEQVGVVLNKTGNAFFLDSCLVHCQTLSEVPWSQYKIDGRSMNHAVYDWYNNLPVKSYDCDYPCNPTCPGVYPPPPSPPPL